MLQWSSSRSQWRHTADPARITMASLERPEVVRVMNALVTVPDRRLLVNVMIFYELFRSVTMRYIYEEERNADENG